MDRCWGRQELTGAGGKTVWGDPADIGAAVGGASFDVVLDNNGKGLDAVKYVRLVVPSSVVVSPVMQT
jgi:hypothetical protein